MTYHEVLFLSPFSSWQFFSECPEFCLASNCLAPVGSFYNTSSPLSASHFPPVVARGELTLTSPPLFPHSMFLPRRLLMSCDHPALIDFIRVRFPPVLPLSLGLPPASPSWNLPRTMTECLVRLTSVLRNRLVRGISLAPCRFHRFFSVLKKLCSSFFSRISTDSFVFLSNLLSRFTFFSPFSTDGSDQLDATELFPPPSLNPAPFVSTVDF